MIRAFRICHRFLFYVLAMAIPILLIFGISLREPPIKMPLIPEEILKSGQLSLKPFPERGFFTREDKLKTHITVDEIDFSILHVTIQPADYLKSPELLVYWTEEEPTREEGVLRRAYLLGTLSGQQVVRFILPEAAKSEDGFLFLYNLTAQKIIHFQKLKSRKVIGGEINEFEI